MSLDMKASAGRESSIRPTIRRMIVKLGTKFPSKRPCVIGRITIGEMGQSYNSSSQQQPDVAGTCIPWISHSHRFGTQAVGSDTLGARE
jgi:hypothetical protein